MRECKAQGEYGRGNGSPINLISHTSTGKPLNFKFCAHLLFGLEASAEFGAPNLRPRCAKVRLELNEALLETLSANVEFRNSAIPQSDIV